MDFNLLVILSVMIIISALLPVVWNAVGEKIQYYVVLILLFLCLMDLSTVEVFNAISGSLNCNDIGFELPGIRLARFFRQEFFPDTGASLGCDIYPSRIYEAILGPIFFTIVFWEIYRAMKEIKRERSRKIGIST